MKKIIFLISFLISVVTANAGRFDTTQTVYTSNSFVSINAISNSIFEALKNPTPATTVWHLYDANCDTTTCSIINTDTTLFAQSYASSIVLFTLNIPETFDTLYANYKLISDSNKIITIEVIIIKTLSIENTIITSSIEVYPNPFIDNVNLKVNALESSISNITLTDITGKVYENKEVELTQGENIINVPVNCPKGLYLLSLIMENKIIKYKIIK